MLALKNLKCEYRYNPVGIDVKNPCFCWILDSDRRNVLQKAYRIQVSEEKDFSGELAWDSGIVHTAQSIHVKYAGRELKSRHRYYYRVQVWDNHGEASDWSHDAFFETGLMGINEWNAEWIAPDINMDKTQAGPSPFLRTTFESAGKIKNARIYVTSLGLYELHLNGTRVGDAYFTPGWTSYNKVLQYQTYDITSQLREGGNAVGAVLGEGWYCGNLAWQDKRNIFGDEPALLLQLHIEYEDGSVKTVISDKSWKASTGPILKSEIYNGELYDANLEKTGWNTVNYDDSGWLGVKTLEHGRNMITAQINEPVRIIEEILPVKIIKTPMGETVIDFGQNMVGWVRFRVSGSKGSRAVFRHAEVLDRDGNFHTDNLRHAKQTIEYVLKGLGEETFEPHFTFQGFRYVKLDEFPCEPKLKDFTGIVLHTDMEPTGSFECSDRQVNQLQHNITWGQKGNFLDVPTDCPQRDERLGWTGDAQVFVRTAAFNMNVALFFRKWLNDLKADQSKEKGVPFVIPLVLNDQDDNDYSSAAWGDAAVICPWTMYLCYGDAGILEAQYESMRDWVEYIRRQGDNEFLWNIGFHFGDWLALDSGDGSYIGATAVDFIATAFYAYSADILAKTASILGNVKDAEVYNALHENVIKAFRNEFVTPSGRLAVPTQTAHVLALMFDLLDPKDTKRAAETLAGYLKETRYHLKTGFVGTPYLCHVLSRYGYNDIAYKLLLQTDYPSWLYPISKGATTIWEHWDGIKPDGSFWSAAMNSFNHYAYGAIGDWLYRVVAGLDTSEAEPGYKHIVIKPQPCEGLDFANASFNSMYGLIRSEWEIENGMLTVKAVIPCNATAELFIQDTKLVDLIKEKTDEGLIFAEADGGIRAEVGSGEYVVCCRLKIEN